MNIEKYLSNFYKGTKNPSLSAMRFFINKYNGFEKNMKFIHIAGTNGKGSCTEMISNILVCQGYKVGKFMSPHLIKYNERISINGKEILDKEIESLIKELEPKIEEYNSTQNVNITLFELETIMALLYFYRNSVDFVVLETGLGGLYDCTNIITNPLVSVITSIGYDHMNILGNTLEEIAYQKAGIIKNNSNTVFFTHSQNVNDVIYEECNKKNNTLHLITNDDIKNYDRDDKFQYFDYKDLKRVAINLKGIKQIENASLCIESIKTLNQLGYNVSEENIRRGLITVIHRGRMEEINTKPLIIYDGAHNEPAINNFIKSVNMYYKDYKRVYIISILQRKDYNKMLKILLQDENAIFILTSGNDEQRYTSKEELYKIAIKYKKTNQQIYMKTLDEALDYAMQENNNANFIVGSFYVYGTIINKIRTNM